MSVRTKVLVAETLCDLHIAVKTGTHEKLLKDLRALRKGIETSRMHAARYKIIARAFRCTLAQNRCLDIYESFIGKKLACKRCHAMAENEVFLQISTAQIQITVLQTQIFFGLAAFFHLERRCVRLREDTELLYLDLDMAGRKLIIDSSAALLHLTDSCHDIFRVQPFCFLQNGRIRLTLFEDQLYDTGAVAQIHKVKTAFIAVLLYPTHHGNCFTHIGK